MKFGLAALSAVLILGSAACDRQDPMPHSGDAPAVDAPSSMAVMPSAPGTSAPGTAAVGDAAASAGASNDASAKAVPASSDPTPSFAQVYPGATLAGDPTVADGPAGPGGMVSFTTQADPDTVVTFYRTRAEAAGLASVMSMNQGDSRGYGALKQASGSRLQVVATTMEDKTTSVLLTWSVGK